MPSMRINVYLAATTHLSRRAADAAVAAGRVIIDGQTATLGQVITDGQKITLDGQPLKAPATTTTILLHKPIGFVVSRDGQGSKTIYDLLPPHLHHLKPVGRLDKDSSGLLLLTNDGHLAQKLTHPSYEKTKIYEVMLNKPLQAEDETHLNDGVLLEDGPSRLTLQPLGKRTAWQITMHEGRNRQIRRTFAALGYQVTKLHRTQFGPYHLPADLTTGSYTLATG